LRLAGSQDWRSLVRSIRGAGESLLSGDSRAVRLDIVSDKQKNPRATYEETVDN
jgi:hypothetical protein